MIIEQLREQIIKDIEDLKQKCKIETDEDWLDWMAETITVCGGAKYINLLQKKAQLDILDKLTKS